MNTSTYPYYAYTCLHAHVHKYRNTYMCTYKHRHVHPYMHINTYKHTCTHPSSTHTPLPHRHVSCTGAMGLGHLIAVPCPLPHSSRPHWGSLCPCPPVLAAPPFPTEITALPGKGSCAGGCEALGVGTLVLLKYKETSIHICIFDSCIDIYTCTDTATLTQICVYIYLYIYIYI